VDISGLHDCIRIFATFELTSKINDLICEALPLIFFVQNQGLHVSCNFKSSKKLLYDHFYINYYAILEMLLIFYIFNYINYYSEACVLSSVS